MAMLEQVFSAGLPPRVAPGAGWRDQPVPSLLVLTEQHLTALEEVSEDPQRRFDLHLVLVDYVQGMAITLAAEDEAQTDTGVDAEFWVDHDPATARGMRRLAGPAMRRAGPYVYDLDRAFHVGLSTMLDGIA